MTTWNSGYVTDVGYVHGYCDNLNPLRIPLAFLDSRIVFPEVQNACELGFGQGISVNIHAAASAVRWWGTDFNPAQVAFARELSRACASGALLEDQSFEEFCSRPDLPNFDYIGLHGVWSWISDENRAIIIDFIRRRLRVGGVVSISYNTQPGWIPTMPLRELLFDHSEIMGAPGQGVVSRIDRAVDFVKRLFATNPAHVRENPGIVERLKHIAASDPKYIAHEYLNRHWHPMSITRVAAWLSAAKLDYACSADALTQIDAVNLLDAQRELLNEIPDPIFRESVRDVMVDRQFRRDYWIKGIRHCSPLKQAEHYRARRVILAKPRASVSLELEGVLGRAALDGPASSAVLDVLADHRPRTIGEIEPLVRGNGIGFPEVVQAVALLAGIGVLSSAQDDAVVELVKSRTDRLNRHLLLKSRDSAEFHYVASPVTGGGLFLERVPQLLLLSHIEGKATLEDAIANVWKYLQMQGQRLIKNGQALETDEANLTELETQAKKFVERDLPVIEALKIV